MPLAQVSGAYRVAMEPDLRFAPSGVAVWRARAVNGSKKKVNDEWVDDKSCWVNLLAFDKQAEHAAESYKKGDLVVVSGKLQTEDWEDDKGGKRTSVTIVLDEIGMSSRFVDVSASAPAERSAGRSSGSAPDPANNPWVAPTQTEEPPF